MANKKRILKKKPLSIHQLISTLTRECKVVLIRDEVTKAKKIVPAKKQKKGKQRRRKKNQIVRTWIPSVDDIVWGKMKGFASWPAKVE